jgi:hypothetical protein
MPEYKMEEAEMSGKTHGRKLKDGAQCAVGARELRCSLQSVLSVLPSLSLLKTLTAKQRGDAHAWALARRKWERDSGGLHSSKPSKMTGPLMRLLRLICDIPAGGQIPENGKLTMKQVERHLATGASCPFCAEEVNITGESVDIDGNLASQQVSCQQCGRTWRDIYRLADVEEILKH